MLFGRLLECIFFPPITGNAVTYIELLKLNHAYTLFALFNTLLNLVYCYLRFLHSSTCWIFGAIFVQLISDLWNDLGVAFHLFLALRQLLSRNYLYFKNLEPRDHTPSVIILWWWLLFFAFPISLFPCSHWTSVIVHGTFKICILSSAKIGKYN